MMGVGISGTKAGFCRLHFKCKTFSSVLKFHNPIVHRTRKKILGYNKCIARKLDDAGLYFPVRVAEATDD